MSRVYEMDAYCKMTFREILHAWFWNVPGYEPPSTIKLGARYIKYYNWTADRTLGVTRPKNFGG